MNSLNLSCQGTAAGNREVVEEIAEILLQSAWELNYLRNSAKFDRWVQISQQHKQDLLCLLKPQENLVKKTAGVNLLSMQVYF